QGKLPVPIVGSVLERFGAHRHEEFDDVLFSKGMEFRADVGAKVLAVAAGKVVYSGVLPAYGNVVILDHGARYYTLYGRLASSLVSVGRVVNSGEMLAVVGQPDDKGRNFYFEIRLRGKAVDPNGFFGAHRLS